MASDAFGEIGFLGFDVFGTVVDWRSGVARAVEPFLERHGVGIDFLRFADAQRWLYQPAMERVRLGTRPWVKLEVLNRENLEAVLQHHGVDAEASPGVELADLAKVRERLGPRPDAVDGLTRLKRHFA